MTAHIVHHNKCFPSGEQAFQYMFLLQTANKAQRLEKEGNLEEAERLFRLVMEAKPAAGFDVISQSITKHCLAKVLYQREKYDEAINLFTEALTVQEPFDVQAGKISGLCDSNVTREELAKVYEAIGNRCRVLELRILPKRVCANRSCLVPNYEQLSVCGRCKCVYYCSKICQQHDWSSRHRRFCRQLQKNA